jgi:2C-methyl-D-erythritol 2,4-cyclodiphosphate synthase
MGQLSLSVAISFLQDALAIPGSDKQLINAGTAMAWADPVLTSTDLGDFAAAVRCASESSDSASREQWLRAAVERHPTPFLPEFADAWVVAERHRIDAALRQSRRALADLLANAQPAMATAFP